MKSIVRLGILVFSLFLVFSTTASAALISASLTDLGSRQWQIDYQVTDFDSEAYDDLVIYFDYNQFQDITLLASPSQWDTFVAQPESIFGVDEDGFLDAMVADLDLTGMLTASFSVQVQYLGQGMPGSQAFDLFNSSDFSTPVAGGNTAVPIPGTLGLLMAGLSVVAAGKRKKLSA